MSAGGCGKANAINIPFGDGSYHPSMVILGMVFCWVYHITSKSFSVIHFDISNHHTLGIENSELFGQLIPTQREKGPNN
jgi:hypothetical protein